MKQILLLVSLSLFISSCARKRMMERVQQYNIRTIAILPAQLEVTGNIPKKLTPEQVKEMIAKNNAFLNRALYIDLVQYVDTRLRRYSQVQFQSTERTKKLLANGSDGTFEDIGCGCCCVNQGYAKPYFKR
jgi:hypothetical protein